VQVHAQRARNAQWSVGVDERVIDGVARQAGLLKPTHELVQRALGHRRAAR